MKRTRSILLGVIALGFLIACGSGNEGQPTTRVESKIFVSNYPLAYFAQRISGDPHRIYFPDIDGDPAFWVPNPEQIVKIQQCYPLFLNGATYEKWRKTVTLPERRIVDTSSWLKDRLISIENVATHQHGPAGDHSHDGTAFTTWLDFSIAAKQAMSFQDKPIENQSLSSDTFRKNLFSVVNDLLALDKEMKKLTSQKTKPPLIASHPIYQYFARAYGQNIRYVLWEPEIYPDEQQWQALEKTLTSHPAKWMIWEGPPLKKSVQRLKKMGLGSVVFDPCANTPDSGDFLTVMKQNIENLRPVFSP